MKENIVTFQVAKLAKEKGFNEPCLECYVERGTLYNNNRERIKFTNKQLLTTNCSAPTQSLLQKWLREEHNIHCIVSPVMGDKNGYDSYPLIGWRCDVIGLNKDSTNSYYMGYPILDWFTAESLEEDETLEELNINRDDTYEEALEKGLQAALKLIKE